MLNNLNIQLSQQNNISCSNDQECGFLNHCNALKYCEHDDLTFGWVEIISYLLIIIIVGLANVGGIGGGIVKLPIIVLLLNYSIQSATFLAYPIILGGVFSNVLLLIGQRHPRKDKPIIDYNIALILLPSILLGTNIGVVLNAILSELILSIAFILFLCCVSPYLYFKAKQLQAKESLLANNSNSNQDYQSLSQNEQTTNVHHQTDLNLIQEKNKQQTKGNKKNNDNDNENNKDEQENVKIIEQQEQQNNDNNGDNTEIKTEYLIKVQQEEQQLIPLKKILYLIIIFTIITLIGLIRGGKGMKSILGIERCGSIYYILTILQLISSLIFIIIIYIQQQNQYNEKKQSNYEFDNEEIQFNTINFILLSISGILAGIITGMLAMGGGMIVIPVLLYLGCNPRVSSATSGFMYLFIGATSILYIITEGYLSYEIILFYALLGILGGVVVSKIIYTLLEKFNHSSIIIYILLFLALLNLFSTPYYLYSKMKLYGFESLTQYQSFC